MLKTNNHHCNIAAAAIHRSSPSTTDDRKAIPEMTITTRIALCPITITITVLYIYIYDVIYQSHLVEDVDDLAAGVGQSEHVGLPEVAVRREDDDWS